MTISSTIIITRATTPALVSGLRPPASLGSAVVVVVGEEHTGGIMVLLLHVAAVSSIILV